MVYIPYSMYIFEKLNVPGPGRCGSVDWALVCKPKIKCIGVTLVNKIIQVSSLQFYKYHRCIALCTHHPKSNHLLSSSYSRPPLPFPALHPHPPGNHQIFVFEFCLFICCFQFYIPPMSEIIRFLTFSLFSHFIVLGQPSFSLTVWLILENPRWMLPHKGKKVLSKFYYSLLWPAVFRNMLFRTCYKTSVFIFFCNAIEVLGRTMICLTFT